MTISKAVPVVRKTEQFLKRLVLRDWTDAAAAWRRWDLQVAVQTRAATEVLLQAAGVAPGMQVLDLASGTGEPALTLATAVGPRGHVTATDLVPGMLAGAAASAHQRGVSNLCCLVADAEALPVADQAVDAVTCRFGVMFFPDVRQALGESHRILKPGGRAAFVAWGPLEANPALESTLGILLGHTPLPALDPRAPNPFKFDRPDALAAALRTAGFRHVQAEARTVPWPWPGSAEQFWQHTRGGTGMRRLLESLPPDGREQVVGEVLAAIRRFDDGRRLNFRATIVVASGAR